MNIRFRNFIIAIVVTGIILGIASILNLQWIFLLSNFGAIGLSVFGALLLILRFSSFVSRQSFWYILFGTMNLSLGIVFIFQNMVSKDNQGLPEFTWISATIGLILLVDSLLLKRNPNEMA
jgi:hypothetical protein